MAKQIAILGCGPAGLLAAHAAKLMGHSVTIFSKRIKSQMRGAQYMHRAIPELAIERPVKLAYVLHGNVEDYREKVYGDAASDLEVSPQTFAGYHEAWSIRQAYNLLWRMYQGRIIPTDITQETIMRLMGNYDAILSTIPAPLLCYQDRYHHFNKVTVWIDQHWHGGNPELNLERYGTNHVVICNGKPFDAEWPHQTGWYRSSLIYSQANTEWVGQSVLQFMPMGVKAIHKPISTNCNCWPTIVRAGRYGEWRKGVLSHEAFETALEVFA